MRCIVLRHDLVEFEDGQEHGDHDPADDHAQENDQHRLNQRGEGVEHRFDFFVPEIGHFLEHVVDLAGGFTRRDHSEKHGRENRFLRHRDGEVVTFFDIFSHALNALFHYVITGGATDNLQHFQNWYAAADELSKGPRETRHANFVRERAEHRQFQLPAVGELLAAL